MAYIAEELLLLLLDNAAARPALDDAQRQRLLSAAVLLDLAYACRIRPSEVGDPVPLDRLVVLQGHPPAQPVPTWALHVLSRKPISAATAITKLSGKVENALFEQLERTGLIITTRLYNGGLRRRHAWTLTDRTRPARARAAILASLTTPVLPSPTAAAIIVLLADAGELGALLSFDAPGWQRVLSRAGEISSGIWVTESAARLAEVNLAVTAAALRPALQAG